MSDKFRPKGGDDSGGMRGGWDRWVTRNVEAMRDAYRKGLRMGGWGNGEPKGRHEPYQRWSRENDDLARRSARRGPTGCAAIPMVFVLSFGALVALNVLGRFA
jgi:hypothetical protein